MKSILPLTLRAFICAPAAWPSRKPARRPTDVIESHSASVTAKAVSLSKRLGEALCTNMEMDPSARTAASNNRRGAVASCRSAAMKVASSSRASAVPACSAMSLRTSQAPSAAKTFGMPRPMPDAAPVTSAVSPASNSIRPSPIGQALIPHPQCSKRAGLGQQCGATKLFTYEATTRRRPR